MELASDSPLSLLAMLLLEELQLPEDAALQLTLNARPLYPPPAGADPDATLTTLGLHDGSHLVAALPGAAPSAASATAAASSAPSGAAAGATATPPAFSMPSLAQLMAGAAGSTAQRRPQVGPSLADAERVMAQLKADPYQLSSLQQNWPALADAVKSGEAEVVRALLQEDHDRKQARAAEQARLMANPMDPDAQRLIEEQIQLENIEALRQSAMEHMPESFGSVVMLYVHVRVNGIALKAFVDSGAQMTIMSQRCAERCGILRLVDRRFQGMAVGVGQQKILGRVHMYQLEVAGDHLPTSFSILENQPMDMLLGLDMLRRHQCCIDLRSNQLVIGTTGNSTPFLGEADIPRNDRLTSDDDAGAGGAASAGGDAGAAADPAKEAAVAALLALGGFTREQALEALAVCDGDQERAASYLLAMKD